MSTDARLRGLYVITDASLCASRGIEASVEAALEGGASLVQYRDKSNEHARRHREALALRALCETWRATFIVNDDVALARAVDADGVHLGCDDMNIGRAREMLGEHAVVGISCYDDFDRALIAQAEGASYVAFGSVFPSTIKPDAVRASLTLFERARHELAIPACAIGGIDRHNIRQVVTAGAAMAAVISAVFEAADIEAASRELARAFCT